MSIHCTRSCQTSNSHGLYDPFPHFTPFSSYLIKLNSQSLYPPTWPSTSRLLVSPLPLLPLPFLTMGNLRSIFCPSESPSQCNGKDSLFVACPSSSGCDAHPLLTRSFRTNDLPHQYVPLLFALFPIWISYPRCIIPEARGSFANQGQIILSGRKDIG